MQAEEALLYAAARELVYRLFLGSSAVEHPTVNRMVAGSNPARGAIGVDTISPVTSTRMLPIADNCFMACLKVARRSRTSAAPVITEVQ